MDSLIFQAMAVELKQKLANGRLDRVVQTTAGTFVLRFWTGREKLQLLLKADGQGAFYLTRQTHPAPATPPRFCQLLRARLRRILDLRAEPLDRIVHFNFAGPDNERYDLTLEAFGAQGNLVLTDAAGRIVDVLRRVDGARKLLPGEVYELPVQRARLSLLAEQAEVLPLLSLAKSPQEMTQLDVAPMSPALAQAFFVEKAAGNDFETTLERVRKHFSDGSFSALQVSWDDQAGFLPCRSWRPWFSLC